MISQTRSAGQSMAQVVVRSLVNQGVRHIFGIPGGKIMPLFDVLRTEGPELVLCRHEQNAAFMAAAIGRISGRPGVCVVTSGPGVGNLVTGVATATTEGDPMVAIGGAVPLPDTLRQVHQSLEAVATLKAVTKSSVSIDAPDGAAMAVANAFRVAMNPRPGATFLSLPSDVQQAQSSIPAFPRICAPVAGAAPSDLIEKATEMLASAKFPAILLGLGASAPRATAAVRRLLEHFGMCAVGTFQGAGSISRKLLPLFFGRIGLFRNQPGDKVLALADVVLSIGYDQVEYGADTWNPIGHCRIIHVGDNMTDLDDKYLPEIELLGAIDSTLDVLTRQLPARVLDQSHDVQLLHLEFEALGASPAPSSGPLLHPLSPILALRSLVDDDTFITSDMGSHHIWMARHFYEFEPRRLLFSNGQQTLGVGIPWAIAAALLHPERKVIASVGDGGFLYSSMDLETAVRSHLNITVLVYRDGGYDMVAFQQVLSFGHSFGVKFGNPDIVEYAESFGAIGMRVTSSDEVHSVLKKAIETPGVVVVDLPVDYSKNEEIGEQILPKRWDL